MDSLLRVKDLMSRDVATLNRNDPMLLADDVMRLGRIRHMPVIDERSLLCGIVSQRDLFRGALAQLLDDGSHARTRLLASIRVKAVMTDPVVTIDAETPIAEAAKRMLDAKIGSLVIAPCGQVEGILTEADFVALIAGRRETAASS